MYPVHKIKDTEIGLFCSRNNDEVWKEFSEGLLYYRMSKNTSDLSKKREFLCKAVKKFTKFISLKPDYKPVYSYLGISYYRLEKYNLALKALNEAISGSDEKNNLSLFLYRGLAYQKLSENKKAVSDYSRIIEYVPDCSDAYYHRAMVFIETGHVDEAVNDLTNAVNLIKKYQTGYNRTETGCPSAVDLRFLRAECYVAMRDYNNAIYDYTKILEKDTNTGILCKRGECYYYTGNYIKALADLSSVIEEDPYNDGAYYLRGSVYIALSDFELALSDFTQSVNLLLNNAKAYIRRAYVQSYLGNHTEALKDLETAKEIEPSSMELYRTYGVVFLHMHMKAKAAEYLKIAAGMGDKASQSWLKKKGFTLKEYGQV